MTISVAWRFKYGALFLYIAATLSSAQGQGFTFQKVSPPRATYSFAAAINQRGTALVGAFQDAGSPFKGFAYNGTRYQTIVFPGASATQAAGVNDSNTVVGFFDGNDGFTHGFLLNHGKLTQYDVNKGVISTSIYGVNNAGNFTGYVGFNGANQGFVNIGGTVTQFTVNGNPTIAIAIDSANNTVGSFVDPNFINTHGFYRDAATGEITQIDYPGSGVTGCQGINDLGEITGFYVDSQGASHGFVTKNGKFRTVPLLDIAGVNNHRTFVGYYVGTNGVTYGYVAKPR